MAAPITRELITGDWSNAKMQVVSRRASEIVDSLVDNNSDRNYFWRAFMDTFCDHDTGRVSFPDQIESDQVEDLILGRSVHRYLATQRQDVIDA